jgi:hypothetical protein
MAKFATYPKKFGIQIHPPREESATEKDLETLEVLRDYFWEEEGKPLSWKIDLEPVSGDFDALLNTLNRLWRAGIILKFASQFHTISNEPEYIKWFIWEEE